MATEVIVIPSDGGLSSITIGTTPITGGTAGSVLFVDSTGSLGQDNANFFWDNTNDTLLLTGLASAQKRLIVRGAPSQTANLQEWQDSTSTAVALVKSSGTIQIGGGDGTSTNPSIYINNLSSVNPNIRWNTQDGLTGLRFYSSNFGEVGRFQDNGTIVATTFATLGELTFGSFYFSRGAFGGGPYIRLGEPSGEPAVLATDANGSSVSTHGVLQVLCNNSASVGIVIKAASSQSATLQEWRNSSNTVLASVSAAGLLKVASGGSTGFAKVGGTIFNSTTQTGNSTTTETDLFSNSIAASVLGTDGDSIEFYAAGTYATSVNSKQLRVKYGSTTIFDSGSLAITVANTWSVRGSIIRTGASTQKAIVQFESSSTVLSASASFTSPGETLSGAVTLKVTGQGTASNDIVGEIWKGLWQPAA
jgi:hypothetical protein